MKPMPNRNEPAPVESRRLGRLPVKSTRKALMFSDFFKFVTVPTATRFWTRRAAIPLRTYGNDAYGDCTRAKQAVATTRMERLEQRRLVTITDDEVIRVYTEMSDRLYGGGDNGAYEDDALAEWRNPEKTFKDTTGHPYTIDAYLRLNAFDHNEVKAALALSGAHGIPLCINLPAAFQRIEPPADWDIPEGQSPVGPWMPGTWGGHSMYCHDYDADGLWLDHTWMLQPQRLTWRAAAIYLDEVHMIIDSLDSWRKAKKASVKVLANVRDAVNAASSIQI